MNTRNNRLIFFLMLGLLLFVGCNRNTPKGESLDQPTTLQTASVRLPIPVVDGAFAPFYAARDKGFFEKHGLEISLEYGSPELNPVKMVSAGNDEIGVVGGPELFMTGRDKGVKIKAFGLLHKSSNFVCLLTKKQDPPVSLESLNGKDVGFFYGHISTDVLRALFKKEGITVNEVDVGFNYNLFIADKLDAQWAFRPTAGVNLPARGIEVDQISPLSYGIETHGYTLFATENTFAERPELIEAFLAAMIEATAYSLDHREESVALTLKEANIKGSSLTPEIVNAQLDIYEPAIRNNERLYWIDTGVLESTRKRLIQQELLSDSFDLTASLSLGFVESYYAKKAERTH